MFEDDFMGTSRVGHRMLALFFLSLLLLSSYSCASSPFSLSLSLPVFFFSFFLFDSTVGLFCSTRRGPLSVCWPAVEVMGRWLRPPTPAEEEATEGVRVKKTEKKKKKKKKKEKEKEKKKNGREKLKTRHTRYRTAWLANVPRPLVLHLSDFYGKQRARAEIFGDKKGVEKKRIFISSMFLISFYCISFLS